MKTEYHAFVDEDAGLCGAVLRRIEPRSMRTRTVFKMGDDARPPRHRALCAELDPEVVARIEELASPEQATSA